MVHDLYSDLDEKVMEALATLTSTELRLLIKEIENQLEVAGAVAPTSVVLTFTDHQDFSYGDDRSHQLSSKKR